MTTSAELIEKLAVKHEAFGFGLVDPKGYTTHGFDPDGLHAFVNELLEPQDKLQAAARLALEALKETHYVLINANLLDQSRLDKNFTAAEALRQVIEKAEQTGHRDFRVPDGWKLVPIEPTGEMSYAGLSAFPCGPARAYKAMLSAAPPAPAPAPAPAQRKPFAYYDPSTKQFAIDKDELPRGAVVWPVYREQP